MAQNADRPPLEEHWKCTASQILDAILHTQRTQTDVKGQLAELQLHKLLRTLEQKQVLTSSEWLDQDGTPDFEAGIGGKTYRIECKNICTGEEYKTGDRKGMLKVECQRT